MKKIIYLLTLSMLISCSDDKDSTVATSTNNEAIRLLKIKDKSNFTEAQFRTIVDYLDEHPEISSSDGSKINLIKREGTSSSSNSKKKQSFW